jgi:glycolate oxidase iron-sulfur subunit
MSADRDPSPLASPSFQAGLEACIHCGLCLSACPTFALLGAEPDGPRGRIALLGAAARGEIDLHAQPARTHLDRCLGCRACETACPSGVPFGHLLEQGRSALVAAEPTTPAGRGKTMLRRSLLGLLARRRTLRALARVAAFAERTGLLRLAQGLPLPPPLAAALRLTPPAALHGPRPPDRGLLPADGPGPRRGAVALFRGCVQDAGLGAVHSATVALLRARGYDVHLVPEQTCCGALARHAGETAIAEALARRNRAAFAAPEVADLPIVVNAGGCAATLAEDGRHAEGPPEIAHAAQSPAAASSPEPTGGSERSDLALGPRIVDLSAFLAASDASAPADGGASASGRDATSGPVDLDDGAITPSMQPPDQVARHGLPRVAYLDSCHLRHGLGVAEAPRRLIAAQAACEAVELPHPDRCCGSAGTYNLLQPELAEAVLARRLDDLRAARPDIVVVANPGCQLQLLEGVRRAGLPIEVLHLAQWLARMEGLELRRR